MPIANTLPTVKPEPEQEGKGSESEEVVEKDGKMNGGENGKDGGATDEDTSNEDNGKNGEATSDGDQKDDESKPDPAKEEPADKGEAEDNAKEETAKANDSETAKPEEKEVEKEKQEEKKKPVKPKPFKVQYIHATSAKDWDFRWTTTLSLYVVLRHYPLSVLISKMKNPFFVAVRPVRLRGERAGGPQLPQEEVREGQLRQRQPLRVQVRVLRHLRIRLQREGKAQHTQGRRDHALCDSHTDVYIF